MYASQKKIRGIYIKKIATKCMRYTVKEINYNILGIL